MGLVSMQPGAALSESSVSWYGKVLYFLLPVRRAVMRSNVRQVYGARTTDQEIRTVIQAHYSHLCRSVLEYLGILWRGCSEQANKLEIRGIEYLDDAVRDQRGVLLLSGHIGNWELAPLLFAKRFPNYRGKVSFVRRPIGFGLDRIINGRFLKFGLNVIAKEGSVFKILRALKKNEIVLFVLDQYASEKNRDGVEVPFFGRKSGTSRGLAFTVKRSKAPVVPVSTYRTDEGRHVIEFLPPLQWRCRENLKLELEENTKYYNRTLEGLILGRPEQWLWGHQRWKSRRQRTYKAAKS